MKHTLAAAFATVALAMPLPSLADDTIKAEMSDITLHPFHHASLLLVWNGVSILVDPAPKPGGQEGSPITEFSAEGMPNIILVTHQHGDHYNADILEAMTADATLLIAPQDVIDIMPDDLKAKATPMANGETKEVFGLTIEAVPAYNISADRLKFHPEARGDNGYIVTLGGKRVYIAGDTEDTKEMRALKDIAVAFLPMNLPYTMDIEHAADAVKAFKPAIVYPYHYGESDVNAFKEMVGDAADVRLLDWY